MAARPLTLMARVDTCRGFTLLELLVVMVIIGIIAAMATISLGVATSEKGAEKEIQRIEDLLALASEESVLQGREFGVTFYAREYVFSIYDPAKAHWVTLERADSEVFGPRPFPPETVVELEIDSRLVGIAEQRPVTRDDQKERDRTQDKPGPMGQDRNRPQVFILSSGDMTPFELHLRPAVGAPGITLAVAENGDVRQFRDEP